MSAARKRLWLFAVLLLLITAGLIWLMFAATPPPPQRQTQEERFTVDTQTLASGRLAPQITLLGVIESTQEIQLRSRLNATIETVYVFEGAQLAVGDPLLRFNETEARLMLTQRESEVAELDALIAEQKTRAAADKASLKTEAALVALSEEGVKRQASLSRSSLGSKEQLEAAQTALAQQELALINRQFTVDNASNQLAQLLARRTLAQAALDLAELDYHQLELKAPVSSRVTSVDVAAGDRVSTGEPLMQLVALDSLHIRVQVPDRWLPLVQSALRTAQESGDKSETEASAHIFGVDYALTLSRLSARVSAATGGVDAFLGFAGQAPMAVGKAVAVNLTLPALDAVFAIPEAAIYDDTTVYLLEEHRMQAQQIQRLGRYSNEAGIEQVIVRFMTDLTSDQGSFDGRQLVITELPRAVSGQLVEVRKLAGRPADVQ